MTFLLLAQSCVRYCRCSHRIATWWIIGSGVCGAVRVERTGGETATIGQVWCWGKKTKTNTLQRSCCVNHLSSLTSTVCFPTWELSSTVVTDQWHQNLGSWLEKKPPSIRYLPAHPVSIAAWLSDCWEWQHLPQLNYKVKCGAAALLTSCGSLAKTKPRLCQSHWTMIMSHSH